MSVVYRVENRVGVHRKVQGRRIHDFQDEEAARTKEKGKKVEERSSKEKRKSRTTATSQKRREADKQGEKKSGRAAASQKRKFGRQKQ